MQRSNGVAASVGLTALPLTKRESPDEGIQDDVSTDVWKKISAKKKTRQIVPDKNMSCEPKNPKTFFLQAVCASNNEIKRKKKILSDGNEEKKWGKLFWKYIQTFIIPILQ